MAKNKITTQGYFIKRLRDNGFYVSRVYDRYHEDDERKWSIVINPTEDSLFITCCDNGEWPWRGMFEFNDHGKIFPKGFHINTDSMEVIIKHLLEFNVSRKELNNSNGQRQQKVTKTQKNSTTENETK